MSVRQFMPGETVVRRDVHRGRVWTAQALRAVADDGETLVAACRPGAAALGPTDWLAFQHSGDPADRERAVASLADGAWQLGPWRWRDTVLLIWRQPALYFSVNAFYRPDDDHGLLRWYVNFERPARRTALGFDTFDLLVDLVVTPDLSAHAWKDEDEYAQGRRLGVVDDADHHGVQAAREQVLAMIADRSGPFAAAPDWSAWRSAPDWPATELPPDAALGTAAGAAGGAGAGADGA